MKKRRCGAAGSRVAGRLQRLRSDTEQGTFDAPGWRYGVVLLAPGWPLDGGDRTGVMLNCTFTLLRLGAAAPFWSGRWGSNVIEQLIEAANAEEPKLRGRPRSIEAEAAILRATLQLLERRPLRKVTADAIARRAGVSKATIYKWWPNKSLVALDAYLAGMTERVVLPDTGSAELDFTEQLKSVMAFYVSPLGRLFSQFIAEGQSDASFLALFRERFLFARRDSARIMWRRGVDRGEIREDLDSEIVLDLVYGPMIFRLLAGHGSVSGAESEALVKAIFGGIRRPGYTMRKDRKPSDPEHA